MEPNQLREALAAYAHEAWSGWMRYMFSKCFSSALAGDMVIPEQSVNRWMRQMATPYADLPESEKKSDREEADKMLAIMEKWGLYKVSQLVQQLTEEEE